MGAAKQPDSRPPFFLPAPQLASRPLDFPLRQPIFERDPLHLPPPPPTPSLRRALKWPPWPPDPHRWGYAEGWEHAEPGGTRLDQSLADRALARIELRLAQSYPRHSQRVDIDQRWAGLLPRTYLHRRKRAHKVAKRGPLCMRRCLVAGLLHPAQCHALC